MKQTPGTKLIAPFLLILSVAGIGNGIIQLQIGTASNIVLGVLAFVYSACAAIAAIGIFQSKEWAQKAFAAWAVICVLMIVPMQYYFVGAAWITVILYTFFVAAILYGIYYYLGKCNATH